MEGYAFITLDTTMGDLGDSNSLFSSVLNGLSGFSNVGGRGVRTPTTLHTTENNGTRPPQPVTGPGVAGGVTGSPLEFNFGHRSIADLPLPPSLSSTATSDIRSSMGLPFPSSVEVRLSRTMSSMRNVRSILEAALDEASTSTTEQMQEIRARLRGGGNSQTAQVGLVLNELADLMESAGPRLREVANALQDDSPYTDEQRNLRLYRRVLRTARVVQGMSLIHHFLGSVLASADVDSRRTRPPQNDASSENHARRTPTSASSERTPTTTASNTTSDDNKTGPTKKTKDSSASETSSGKRKATDDGEQSSKKSKGKGKEKTE
ncbi:hypothetical protein DFQ28_004828 [Apophysomyces sp. BC1034]|nr:hypothetical protein DFQ29_007298 [Apophysomyces sp. BC1021]KAG0188448.1 hypothetical protein DFQ28_004828 [Apophysomyces sp. BC1034]